MTKHHRQLGAGRDLPEFGLYYSGSILNTNRKFSKLMCLTPTQSKLIKTTSVNMWWEEGENILKSFISDFFFSFLVKHQNVFLSLNFRKRKFEMPA